MSATSQTLNKPSSTRKQTKELFTMTWPMLIGVLSLMSFQLADSIYIARLGIEPLAVIGFTIPIYQVIIGFQVGIGIATTALISQLLGAKKDAEARDYGGTILVFGTAIIGFLCLLLWVFRQHILLLLGGNEALNPLLSELWSVWLISALTGAVLYFGYSICRAHGNTLLPGAGMVLTSLLNIALDPLFIFYFDLGLVGAAYASLLSFLVGFAIVFPKVFAADWISFQSTRSNITRQIKSISSIATPAMLSQLMPSLSAMIATSVVAQYGTEAVAAWGMGVRLEFFSIVFVLALTMSLPPMIGRYFGARAFLEIKQLVSVAVKIVLICQVSLAAVMAISATYLSQFMSGDAGVSAILSDYLIIIPLSYAPLGICMLTVSICNAIALPSRALAISFLRLFACYLPLLLLGAHYGELYGLMMGAAIGNIAAGIMAWRIYTHAIKKASTK